MHGRRFRTRRPDQTLPAEYALLGRWANGYVYRQMSTEAAKASSRPQYFVVCLRDGRFWTYNLDVADDADGDAVAYGDFAAYADRAYGERGGVQFQLRPKRVRFPPQSSKWNSEILMRSVDNYYERLGTAHGCMRYASIPVIGTVETCVWSRAVACAG